jgi:hypothetical protein
MERQLYFFNHIKTCGASALVLRPGPKVFHLRMHMPGVKQHGRDYPH